MTLKPSLGYVKPCLKHSFFFWTSDSWEMNVQAGVQEWEFLLFQLHDPSKFVSFILF